MRNQETFIEWPGNPGADLALPSSPLSYANAGSGAVSWGMPSWPVQEQWTYLLKFVHNWPWLVWLSGLSAGLQIRGSLVQFPVTAQAWVAGQVPSRGRVEGNHTLMFFLPPLRDPL